MPKIYDQKSGSDSEHGKWGGGGHELAQKRGMFWAIGIVIALVVIFLIYRMARGEDLQTAVTPHESPTVAAFTVSASPLPG